MLYLFPTEIYIPIIEYFAATPSQHFESTDEQLDNLLYQAIKSADWRESPDRMLAHVSEDEDNQSSPWYNGLIYV